jgi:NADPH:quinone reductase-like Zn-dependent oxidoreductase
VTDLADPVPKDNEYLIEVHAAAANFFDILQVQGKYQNQPRELSTPLSSYFISLLRLHQS